jgi:uncharacterized membrane protein
VTFDDWLLGLHLLSAAGFVAGVILFWVVIIAARQSDTVDEMIRLGRMSTLAEAAIGIGSLGTLVLGIWLALSLDGYEIWDGWIIAAIVLWVFAMGVGGLAGAAYRPAVAKAKAMPAAGETGPNAELLALNRTQAGVVHQSLATILLLLILVDMIAKPGA